MNKQRRSFLNQISIMAGVAAISKPMSSIASISKQINTIHSSGHAVTLYHTNDLHGNLNATYNNMGGINKLKTLIENQETNGLLLDAGDFLDGNSSVAEHKHVINLMNRMGYHVATIGNHELLQGQDYLAKLIPSMKFKLVNCNYEFNANLNKLVAPYIIVNSGKFKVGITGVGHQIADIGYNDAISNANKMAAFLKKNANCDLVVCLSHLGYSQKGDLPDNQKLARQSEHIDVVISGHNHKLLQGPAIISNKNKEEVIVSQAAWDGLMLGKTIINFENGKEKFNLRAKHLIAGQPYDKSYTSSFYELRLREKELMAS
jgi:5'-nucleotidase